MNAYALYPARQKIPTWVSVALAGLGASFILLTVVVAIVVVRSQSPSGADLAAALPTQKALVAPAPVAAAVTPVDNAAAKDEAPVAAAPAPAKAKRHAAHRQHIAAAPKHATMVASRASSKGKPHKKDDIDKLLGL